ncbi:MAG: glycosyltransferase, partial [Thermoguttaceae bacterium]|nr:glycosyltransferase [Thermoguttaceae bacterium]
MSTHAEFYGKMERFCRKRGIKLYVESCEWYHWHSFGAGLLDYRYWRFQAMFLFGLRKVAGALSISRLLDAHNRAACGNSVRVPTILDVESEPFDDGTNRVPERRKVVVYTGNPSRSKDLLSPIVKAFATNPELGEKIEFRVYSTSARRVMQNLRGTKALLPKVEGAVVFCDPLPQTEIRNAIVAADFQMFLRPNKTSSNAGFPTKLGESMAVGTPVATNVTGDIGLYLKDGENGFIAPGWDVEAAAATLRRIADVPADKYVEMRKNARKTAEIAFNYKTYIDLIKSLFN